MDNETRLELKNHSKSKLFDNFFAHPSHSPLGNCFTTVQKSLQRTNSEVVGQGDAREFRKIAKTAQSFNVIRLE